MLREHPDHFFCGTIQGSHSAFRYNWRLFKLLETVEKSVFPVSFAMSPAQSPGYTLLVFPFGPLYQFGTTFFNLQLCSRNGKRGPLYHFGTNPSILFQKGKKKTRETWLLPLAVYTDGFLPKHWAATERCRWWFWGWKNILPMPSWHLLNWIETETTGTETPRRGRGPYDFAHLRRWCWSSCSSEQQVN